MIIYYYLIMGGWVSTGHSAIPRGWSLNHRFDGADGLLVVNFNFCHHVAWKLIVSVYFDIDTVWLYQYHLIVIVLHISQILRFFWEIFVLYDNERYLRTKALKKSRSVKSLRDRWIATTKRDLPRSMRDSR